MESMPANRIAMVLVGCALLALNAPRASAFEIRVADAVGGRPLAGASVALRVGDGKNVTLASDSAGKVKISIPGKAAGAVRVTARKDGFAPMTMVWEPGKIPSRFDLLLHFGFEQSPAEMNEAGQRLLLNSIAYISRFTEDRPIAVTPSVFAGSVAFPRAYLDRRLGEKGDVGDAAWLLNERT